jgi:hypothetical protein
MPILAAIPATLHASLLVGISAWNKTPWIVGVIYAGLYFFSTIFSNILASAIDTTEVTEATLRHLSIEGLIAGIGQFILNTTPRSLTPPGMSQATMPAVLPLLLVAAGLVVIGITVARARIRPVEVVQG